LKGIYHMPPSTDLSKPKPKSQSQFRLDLVDLAAGGDWPADLVAILEPDEIVELYLFLGELLAGDEEAWL
jgi:hypothetical protein